MSYTTRRALDRRYGGVFGSEPEFSGPVVNWRKGVFPGARYDVVWWVVSATHPDGEYVEVATVYGDDALCSLIRTTVYQDDVVSVLWYVYCLGNWLIQAAPQELLVGGVLHPIIDAYGAVHPGYTNPGVCCAGKGAYTSPEKHQVPAPTFFNPQHTTTAPYPEPCRCWPERNCPLPDELPAFLVPPEFVGAAEKNAAIVAEFWKNLGIDGEAKLKASDALPKPKAVPPPPVGRPTPGAGMSPAARALTKRPTPGSSTPDAKAAAASSEGTPIPVTVIAGALALGVVVLFAVVASKVAEK